MSKEKKNTRARFNEVCLRRDNHKCRLCGRGGVLDVHHITSRKEMPGGGYVLENGVSLCEGCHLLAETEPQSPKFGIEALYAIIGSSYEEAYESSLNL